MSKKKVIFHFFRKNGTSIFLHPFQNIQQFRNTLDKNEIVGFYGKEPRIESLTQFRNDLYFKTEQAVKLWISEKRFIPKFLISSVVFLISYLFMSFVIRDPIPMLDEILIATGISIFIYIVLSKKDLRSHLSSKERIRLRAKIDSILFEENVFVKNIEDELNKNENENMEKMIESITKNSNFSSSQYDNNLAIQLNEYLKEKFTTKDLKIYEKQFEKLKSTNFEDKDIESISKWIKAKKVDIWLFAIYRKIKSKIEQGK